MQLKEHSNHEELSIKLCINDSTSSDGIVGLQR
jgi:hypothetical protein